MSSLIKLGFHAKTSGGMTQSVHDAFNAGANVVQIFTKSNRQFFSHEPSLDKIEEFLLAQKALNFYDVFVHAGYLINLAGREEVQEKSFSSLCHEISLAAGYNLKHIVLHPGSAGEADRQEACEAVGRQIKKAMELSRAKFGDVCPEILLENMAGQGTVLGSTLAELAKIAQAAGDPGVGFCIDTAHLFASGWDLRDKQVVDCLGDEIKKELSWSRVKAIHLNDSKEPCGGHKDRHENWPQGTIGLKGLENFLSIVPKNIPLILETPVDQDYSKQKDEMKIIRNILKG